MKAFLWGILCTLAASTVIGALLITTGSIPVSAAKPESPLIAWLLHTSYEQRVARHAADITVPADLNRPSRRLEGARSFEAMCSGCHTPPGESASAVSQGLNPPPPKLSELMPHRTPAEAFWVIKNGVRMTGMAAFGPTHDDEQLWALVSFVQYAQTLDNNAYPRFVKEARAAAPADDGHGHRHAGEKATHQGGVKNSGGNPSAPAPETPNSHDHGNHDH